MEPKMRVTAIVGTYRKGGVIDTAVDELLGAARDAGAEVTKIYLIDKQIEFCTNCRTCTQEAGEKRGECIIADEMGAVLHEIERSHGIVLASPVNFSTVTAVMKGFMERLVCYVYWPWGMKAPKERIRQKQKRAVVVCSSAAPGFMSRLTTPIVGLLRNAAKLLGGKPMGVLFIGLAAGEKNHDIGAKARQRARNLGQKLVSHGGV